MPLPLPSLDASLMTPARRAIGALAPVVVSVTAVGGCKRKPSMKSFRFDIELTSARDACPKGASFATNKALIESKLGPADEDGGGVLHWYGSGRGAGATATKTAPPRHCTGNPHCPENAASASVDPTHVAPCENVPLICPSNPHLQSTPLHAIT